MLTASLTRRFLTVFALAVAYFVAGQGGLMLDAVSGFATLVWAPTGISLAALILLGPSVWPGVTIGAFAVNVGAGAPLAVALGIAAGNTLEAVLGAYLLRRSGFNASLSRLRDVVLLIILAAVFCTISSATVGTASLWLGGVIDEEALAPTWTAWWVGDAIGTLVVAPLVLTWSRWTFRSRRSMEVVEVGVLIVVVSGTLFLLDASERPLMFLGPYVLLAPLLWAALRFQTQGASAAVFLVSAIAVTGTTLGRGPLQIGVLNERLWVLQAFIGLVSITFLVLGALAGEREEAERQLILAKEAAEASSGAKSRFLAVMSHELRTPLNSIVGYLNLMEEPVADSSENRRRYHARIRAAAWHLTSVIDGILTFSRAEAGRDSVDLKRFDAIAVVEEMVAFLEPLAAQKGLTLRLIAPSSPIEILSDPGKVRQILLNLVGNAVKFAQHGRIDVEVLSDPGSTVFRVRDEGPGIPSSELESIFEPFNQVKGRTSDVSWGAGLGLSVASMLTNLIGGTLSVETEEGKGSVFTLSLPMTSIEAEADSHSPTPAGRR